MGVCIQVCVSVCVCGGVEGYRWFGGRGEEGKACPLLKVLGVWRGKGGM